MFNYNQNNENTFVNQTTGDIAVPRTFINHVFSWMTVALGITAFFAYYFSTNAVFIASLQTITPTGTRATLLGWVVTLSPLIFVVIMSAGFNKFSSWILTILFIAFSFLMGMSLSFVFLFYTGTSIFLTFAVTAGTFGVMAIAGYTTKTDLSKFGAILTMALIGILIAIVVNIFMHSQSLNYIISIAGVLVFTGLTAWDVQKLKRIGSVVELHTESTYKIIIMGALTLYIDFINLFSFLLMFLGDRK